MRETRIVHLSTVHPRYDTRIYHRELWSLSKMENATVTLVVADGKGNESGQGQDGKRPVIDIGRAPAGRLGRAVIGSMRAVKVAHSLEPDVVHFHDPELIPAALCLKLLGHRVIYDVHEDVPLQILNKHWLPKPLRYPFSWTMKAMEAVGAAAFDGIVVATPDIARRFAEKAVVVQNFPLPGELGDIDEQLSYCDRPPDFAYVGALSAVRGILEIAKAVEMLPDELRARLVLAGTFRPESLHSEVFSVASKERIEYVGWASREELAKLLGRVRAGLVVLHPIPNYLDAYPVKMFEYMACGLPVIASDFPLWRQIVQSAGCGILVDPLDQNAIAAAMQWLLRYPEEAERMGQRGRAAIRELYNWHREAEKLTSLYESMLSPG